MTLKLQQQELHAFIRSLMNGLSNLDFTTEYEYHLSRILLRELLEHLTKRALTDKPKYSIKISDLHVFLLREVLLQIDIAGPYEGAVLRTIFEQIDKECQILNTRFNSQNRTQPFC